ncbi:MgtC/SapB family protein [bacterium]|nr:MgtC/SapB family protein [bacterium]
MTIEQTIEWGSRLLAAILAGAVIGLERERHGKAAGLRTIILICMGSCLFMITSELVGSIQLKQGMANYVSDPGRIAAQVVSGVGFLGAGAVITARDKVYGLTTAAVVWVTAGIGLVIGLDYELFGLSIAVLVTLILLLLHAFERNLLATKKTEEENAQP